MLVLNLIVGYRTRHSRNRIIRPFGEFARSCDLSVRRIYIYIYTHTPCLPRDTFRNLERTSIIGVKTRRYGTLGITRIARRMGNLFRRSRRAAKLTMNDHANQFVHEIAKLETKERQVESNIIFFFFFLNVLIYIYTLSCLKYPIYIRICLYFSANLNVCHVATLKIIFHSCWKSKQIFEWRLLKKKRVKEKSKRVNNIFLNVALEHYIF